MTGRKRNAAADLGDTSDDEPITQTLRKRGGRRSMQESDDEEEEMQVAVSEPEEEDEEVDEGPSTRRRKSKSRRSSRSRASAGEAELAEEEDEEEAPVAKSKAKKKGKRKSQRGASRRNAGSEAPESGAEDSDADMDDNQLEELTNVFAIEATSVTQAESNLVTEAEERKLTRNVMRYMLFNQHTKPGIPMKRQDLINLIMGGYRGSSKMKKLGDLIIKKAQDKFITICGLEMKEITPQLHSRQGQEKGPTVYILRSPLPANLRSFARSESMDLNNAFVMVVASIITLAGGKLTEDDLQLQLEKLGVTMQDRHPVLGKPTEQIQTLVQKKLLAESRENGVDGVKRVYAVGDCFMDEVQGDRLTNFIEKVGYTFEGRSKPKIIPVSLK